MITLPLRFETLIERYHDEIYRYLWRLLNSAGRTDSELEAQDLSQEVFLRAYRSFGRLRRDSNHRAWLYKIATNCAYTALERDQRREHHSVPWRDEVHETLAGTEPSPEQQVDLAETLQVVQRAIAVLPSQQRAAVVLRHGQGLDYAAIAQVLGCSEDSARANVYQALRRLRRTLAGQQAPLNG